MSNGLSILYIQNILMFQIYIFSALVWDNLSLFELSCTDSCEPLLITVLYSEIKLRLTCHQIMQLQR